MESKADSTRSSSPAVTSDVDASLVLYDLSKLARNLQAPPAREQDGPAVSDQELVSQKFKELCTQCEECVMGVDSCNPS